MKRLLVALMIPLAAPSLPSANPKLLTARWPARWIFPPGAPAFEYGVYHFRRTFELPARPGSFIVHVTADNRYQLYVNGTRAAWGPARGDLFHWRYETADLAPHLRAGRNVLAAVVWNEGEHAALSQITHRTAFLLQGDTEKESAVNTDKAWVAFTNPAYKPLPIEPSQRSGYHATGPGDEVDGRLYPWGWESPGFDDSSWKPAAPGSNGSPRDDVDGSNHWMLVPRPIPMMEETPERIARVRRAAGIAAPGGFPQSNEPLRVPAQTTATLLLDQNYLTTAFPELTVSGGRGARISLRYAEALRAPGSRGKGHRDQIEGKQLRGYEDVFIADGGQRRLFRPLFWRTYRYIELTVKTEAEPLAIDELRGVYTGYPFARKARFDGASEELARMLDVGWRTARLCAHETYMDCPYYEQLQYVGDTRIQALVSLYMSGDARLARNAIEQIDSSRTAEGATYSRAPSALQQYIPPFSLWWIGMVHDYWMYAGDADFARRMLPGVRAVLGYYSRYQKASGSLRPMPWWNYVDWVQRWPRGVPPLEPEGDSAPLDLQLLLAYGWAAKLEAALGSKAQAEEYRAQEQKLRATIRNQYWDPAKQLFFDTPRKATSSQHANSLAVLAGLLAAAEARDVMERVAAGGDLTPASIYFRYYVHLAMREAGLGDRYLDMLGSWREALELGMTTWPETRAETTRSDCHAWGASPNIEFFRIILGIDSAAPGFRRVVIRPHPGKLAKVSGAIPHPKGEVAVSLELRDGRLQAEVRLPEGVDGEFQWKEARRPLKPGANKLSF